LNKVNANMDSEKIPMHNRDSEVGIDEKNELSRNKRAIEYEGKTASMPLCVFNLMNAILGSGILGLASSASNLGVGLFTLMLVGVSALAFNSIQFLLEMCDFTGSSSYETLGKHAFGKFGKYFTAINIFLHTMGAMCSFLFVVKYELPEIIRFFVNEECSQAWYLKGDILIIVVTVIVIAPLAAARNIGFLGYTSGLAMACMIIFTGVIVAEHFVIPCPIRNTTTDLSNITDAVTVSILNSTAAYNSFNESLTTQAYSNSSELHCSNDDGLIHKEINEALEHQTCELKMITWNSKSAYAIPTMVFAFQCHASVLPIYTELKNPTSKRMRKVSMISIGNVFILYFLAAFFGYYTFYSATAPELLLMYSKYNSSSLIILASRIMVVVCVTFSTPLLHYPARKAINQMLFEGKTFSWFRHLAIMVILLTTSEYLLSLQFVLNI